MPKAKKLKLFVWKRIPIVPVKDSPLPNEFHATDQKKAFITFLYTSMPSSILEPVLGEILAGVKFSEDYEIAARQFIRCLEKMVDKYGVE